MTYFILVGLIMLVSFIVSSKLKRVFKTHSQERISSGLTGKEVAEKMLKENNIFDVSVVNTDGSLTDHYNPINKTVNLSKEVYYSNSITAAAVAAHECGHAVQHATQYSMLMLRSKLVPIQNASGKILSFIMIASIFGSYILYSAFPLNQILLLIIGCYSVLTLFSLVTLPVEIDASNRAVIWLRENSICINEQESKVKRVLDWAGYTYLVSALGSIAMLLYYISLFIDSRD